MTDGEFQSVEVITGVGRRRCWSVEENLRIIGESLRPGVSVRSVARHHGLNPNRVVRVLTETVERQQEALSEKND